jgi:hypothetical protein
MLPYSAASTYILHYKLKVTSGSLITIGGHNRSFATYMEITHGNKTYKTSDDLYTFTSALPVNSEIEVVAKYNKIIPAITDYTPYIFI